MYLNLTLLKFKGIDIMRERKRKIKVYKTIKKTDFLSRMNDRELLKVQKKDEGVLGLIASSKLYKKEYEKLHKISLFSNTNLHEDFFNDFKSKVNTMSDFELGYMKKYVFNSVRNHNDSYLFLTSLLITDTKMNNYINFIHDNLFEISGKIDCLDKKLNVINYVLSERPKDIVSDSLRFYLVNEKNKILSGRKYIFYE